MSKTYTVVADKKVVFGPTEDYAEVKKFVSKLAPAAKAKCSVQVKEGKPATAASAKPGTAAVTKEKIAPEQHKEEKKSTSGSDDVFSSYMEGGGNSELWKPKDGRNVIRILPIGGVLPSDWVTPYPFVVMGVHPNVGLSLNDTVYCPRLTHGTACPVCNFSWNLYNSTDANDKALSKRIRSYRKVLANIIDLSNIEAGVQKFGFGKKLAEKIMSYKKDPEYQIDGVDFLDPEAGRNFVLIKKKVDNFPNYDDSRPEIKTTALSAIYPNWRAECHDLTKEMKTRTYDEMMQILVDTKKAILSTDPSEWGRPSGGQGTGGPADVVDPDLGIPIIEESADDVALRLNNLQ